MSTEQNNQTGLVCPNCADGIGSVFYEVPSVPTHSVLLFDESDKAKAFQKGNITLAHCTSCDFIWNTQFDPHLEAYGAGYEATQAYSETFNTFHHKLAQHVIDRFGLKKKRVIEIGCGQGEFLSLLCDLGGNEGLGFDPAYDPSRADVERSTGASFVADFYSDAYQTEQADLFCCKMTLEHIPNTLSFMHGIRRAIGEKQNASLFFMIPNADYILDEKAFWDVYYEHCSYFTPAALRRLLSLAQFDVTDIYPVYDDQYLVAEADIAGEPTVAPSKQEPLSTHRIQSFRNTVAQFRDAWSNRLNAVANKKQKAVLWGGGSKAVSFLTTIETGASIEAAVDINPHKWNTFLPGTGHPVVGPDTLVALNPDLVIVMNPVYTDEIQSTLSERGLSPEVLPITHYMPSEEALAS